MRRLLAESMVPRSPTSDAMAQILSLLYDECAIIHKARFCSESASEICAAVARLASYPRSHWQRTGVRGARHKPMPSCPHPLTDNEAIGAIP
jgi:hypothetical protein